MNKNVIIVIVVFIAIAGGIFIYKNSKTADDSNSTPASAPNTNNMTVPGIPTVPPPPTDENTQPVSSTDQGTVKEFTVLGTNYTFNPATITVKKGDTVKITFKDDDGFHDLKIDGYNVATQRVNTGGESSVQFVADKTGSFEYYCSVDSHREKGMKGTFVVTE